MKKTHIPRWHKPRFTGDAPLDWDDVEHTVEYWNETQGMWIKCLGGPVWLDSELYRHTPNTDPVEEPSERAKEAARKVAGVLFGEHKADQAQKYQTAFARFIEEHAPDMLVDPLVALLRDAGAKAGLYAADRQPFDDLAAELHKRKGEVIAALGGDI
jgi:hypothetical protein